MNPVLRTEPTKGSPDGQAPQTHSLAFIGEHLAALAVVGVFVVYKGPSWVLTLLAVEREWEERRARRAKKRRR